MNETVQKIGLGIVMVGALTTLFLPDRTFVQAIRAFGNVVNPFFRTAMGR